MFENEIDLSINLYRFVFINVIFRGKKSKVSPPPIRLPSPVKTKNSSEINFEE